MHTGSYDLNDNMKVSIQPSITGQALWKVSNNFCELNAQEWSLTPDPGKQLLIIKTKLDFTKDVSFTNSAGFQILVGGYVVYNKIYNNMWSFITECDNYQEFTDFNRFSWDYPNALVLKSSIQQTFKVILPSGGLTGTKCHLCIKCVSMDEL